MTDRRLDPPIDRPIDELLRAHFAALADEVAPASVWATVDAIPDRYPARRPWFTITRARPIVVLATVAVLLALAVGAAILIGSLRHVPAPLGIGLIAFDTDGDIVVVGRDGSNRRVITSGPATDFGPTFSPDGGRIAFWSQAVVEPPGSGPSKTTSTALIIVNADGSAPHVVADQIVYPTWAGPRWSPDGRLLAYTAEDPGGQGTQLVVVPADGGPPVVVAASIDDRVSIPWAPDGSTLAYVVRGAIHLVAPDGSGDRVIVLAGAKSDVRWSPDGTRFAYTSDACCGPLSDTWVVDRDGANPHAITDSTGTESFGGWSSDGRSTVINRAQANAIWLVLVGDADGRNTHALEVDGINRPAEWSADGRRLVVGRADGLLIVDSAGVEPPIAIAANTPMGVSWQPVGPRVAVLPAPGPSHATDGSPQVPASGPTPGTRRSTSGFAVPFSFEAALLPGGASLPYWQSAVSPHAYDIASIDFGIAAFAEPRLFADPCHPSAGFARTGTTPADFAAAIATMRGLNVTNPQAVTLDGFSGIGVDLASTTDAASCERAHHLSILEADPGVVESYDLSGGPTSTEEGVLSPRAAPSGGGIYSHWLIVEIGRRRVVLDAWTAGEGPESHIGSLPMLEQTLESVTFE